MSEEESPLLQKEKTWFQKLAKLTSILSALFLISITVLANMGGSSDMLRESVERFTSDMFGGRPAKVGTLERMSFFPKVGVSAKDIRVLSKVDGGYPVISIGKIQIFMGFWDVAWGNPQFSHFYLENAEAIKGAFFPNEFYIERAYVDHDIGNGTAALRANGKIGPYPWSFNAGIEVRGKKRKYKYKLGDSVPFSMVLDNTTFSGILEKHESEYFKIRDAVLTSGNDTLIGGATLSSVGTQLMKLKWNMATKEQTTRFSSEVLIEAARYPMKISGALDFGSVTLEDFTSNGTVGRLLNEIQVIMGYETGVTFSSWLSSAFARYDIDMTFNIDKSSVQGAVLDGVSFPYVQEKGSTKFGPVRKEGNSIFPGVMSVFSDNKLISIIQKGRVNMHTAQIFASNISRDLAALNIVDVGCGIAEFSLNDEGVDILSFGVNLKNGSTSVSEKSIDYKTELKDLSYNYDGGKASLAPVTLGTAAYEFVQENFQKDRAGEECAPYIVQGAKSKEDVTVVQEVQKSKEQ